MLPLKLCVNLILSGQTGPFKTRTDFSLFARRVKELKILDLLANPTFPVSFCRVLVTRRPIEKLVLFFLIPARPLPWVLLKVYSVKY